MSPEETLQLPAPSDPSTPLDLTPSSTPTPTSHHHHPAQGRDPIIQRNAVFGERYLTDPTKVYDYNSWDQVTPDPDHLASALEKIKFQQETRLPEKERKRFLERPAYFWDMFYRNNRENFFKNRKWLTREFAVLTECMKEDVPSPKNPCPALYNPFLFEACLFILSFARSWLRYRRVRELFLRRAVELGMLSSHFYSTIKTHI
jgi:hypothetical protein